MPAAAILAVVAAMGGCSPPRVDILDLKGRTGSTPNATTVAISERMELLSERVGLELSDLKTSRVDGFETMTITARNPSTYPRRFKYMVNWFSTDGIRISSQTSRWIPESPLGGQTTTIRSVAPVKDTNGFQLLISTED